MALVQFLIVGFAIFAIARVFSSFKKGHTSTFGLVAWLVFWTSAGLATILPESTVFFAKLLGVSRGTDVVVYLSITLLFYIVFRIYNRLEKIESDIGAIIKEMALRAGDKEKK